MTAGEGMQALMRWVEQETPPKTVRTVRIDQKGNTLSTGIQEVFA